MNIKGNFKMFFKRFNCNFDLYFLFYRSIHYIERSGIEYYHNLNKYPDYLDKKVTLLRYFRSYMNEHLLKAAASMSPRENDLMARVPSLRTYFRTRSAIILHLTNGTLQV